MRGLVAEPSAIPWFDHDMAGVCGGWHARYRHHYYEKAESTMSQDLSKAFAKLGITLPRSASPRAAPRPGRDLPLAR